MDYGKLYEGRWDLLRKAYERSGHKDTAEFAAFREDNAFWLSDYALFMAVKDVHGGAGAIDWEPDIRDHKEEACRMGDRNCRRMRPASMSTCNLSSQGSGKGCGDYATEKGIRIIGDIPIYVSADSSDFWAHRELFQLDERGRIRNDRGRAAGRIFCDRPGLGQSSL